MRNKVEDEIQSRKSKIRELQQKISENTAELERYTAELDSLIKVEHQQKKVIEKLSNNEPSSD